MLENGCTTPGATRTNIDTFHSPHVSERLQSLPERITMAVVEARWQRLDVLISFKAVVNP